MCVKGLCCPGHLRHQVFYLFILRAAYIGTVLFLSWLLCKNGSVGLCQALEWFYIHTENPVAARSVLLLCPLTLLKTCCSNYKSSGLCVTVLGLIIAYMKSFCAFFFPLQADIYVTEPWLVLTCRSDPFLVSLFCYLVPV